MTLILGTLLYVVLLGMFSIFQGTLNSNQNAKKRKRMPQIVTMQFLEVLVTVGYSLFLWESIYLDKDHWIIPLIIVLAFVTYSFMIIHRFCKGLGVRQEKNLTPRIGFLYRLLHIVCTPFTFFIRIPVFNETEEVTEEDIREMINTSQKGGHLEEPQKELFENVFAFDDTSVEEICTHRNEVVCLYLEDDMKIWNDIIQKNRHTFYPICQEDSDDIIGVLDTRDYFRMDIRDREQILSHAMDKPLFILENTKADDCFMEMKKRKYYFAIVIDEYGGMSGIVTLHDIVETILGEMYEEEDEEDPEEIQALGDQTYRIYGFADLEEVQNTLGISLPVDNYDTFGGYVLGCYGSIPEDGERFDVHCPNMDVFVKEMKNHRVVETIVQIKMKNEEEEHEITAGSH